MGGRTAGEIEDVRETPAIDYLSPDGGKWRAWREMKNGHLGFFQAQRQDKTDGVWTDAISYVAINGAHWCAKWSGDDFIHFPQGRPAEQQRAQVIDYVSWHPSTPTREAWQAYWDGRRKVFVQTRLSRA